MKMQEILENKFLKRSFWISTVSILILLGFIKFFIIGVIDVNTRHWVSFSSGVIEALIATILTTIGIGSYIFYLTPRIDPNHKVSFLPSKEFNDYFESAISSTREWYFRGGLGRFLSTEVLPKMNEVASKTQSPVIVRAQILDPRNSELCEMHAQLRNSVNNADDRKNWTGLDIKISLYTTIVTCAIFESNNSYLDVSVFLINFFSTDRVDVSTTSGIVTKDDRNVPGLKFSKESILYNSYLGDLTVTQKQGDVVKPLSKPYKIGDLTGDNISTILLELGFNDEHIGKEELDKIASEANDQLNPYS